MTLKTALARLSLKKTAGCVETQIHHGLWESVHIRCPGEQGRGGLSEWGWQFGDTHRRKVCSFVEVVDSDIELGCRVPRNGSRRKWSSWLNPSELLDVYWAFGKTSGNHCGVCVDMAQNMTSRQRPLSEVYH
jgi:hypothetical protein